MKNNVLIILGMHRSGTSLVAQWIHQCGIHLGSDLLGSDFSNQKGHFEDFDFLKFHKKILKDNGLPETGLELKNDEIRVEDQHIIEAESIIQAKQSERGQWGWKEPRTVLFLEMYRSLIPDAKYLICFRNCDEVVHSLYRREKNRLVNAYKNQGIKGALKQKLFFIKEMQLRKKKVQFKEQWKIYNKKILTSMKDVPEENITFFDLYNFKKHEKRVFSKLKQWEINFKPANIDEVFDARLLKKSSFVQQGFVDDEALEIENQFYSMFREP